MHFIRLFTLFITVFCLGLSSVSAQAPNFVPQNGLVAWYSFNGNANDASGNNHDGQIYGATSVTDQFGTANSAYYFNGTQSSYIQVPHDNDLNFSDSGSYTISTWIKPEDNAPNGPAGLLSKWNEVTYNPYPYTIRIQDQNNECSEISWANHSSQITNHTYGMVDKHRYSHVVVKVQNYKSYLYINASLIDSTTFPAMNILNTNDLYIGKRTSSTPRCYKGVIDNVGIWNRALTLCEIQNLFLNTLSLEITKHPQSKFIASSNTATFSVTANAPQGATYKWQTSQGSGFSNLNNAGQYSSVNTDSMIITNVSSSNDNQMFRCIITSGHCTDTSSTAILNVTDVGIEERNQQNSISVYPNPASKKITIKLAKVYQNIEVEIFNNYGQIVHSAHVKKQSDIKLSLKQTNGIYFIRIIPDGEKPKVIKLLKIKE